MDNLIAIPLPGTGCELLLPADAIMAGRTALIDRFRKTCAEVGRAGALLDAAEGAPERVQQERRGRYLDAIEAFLDRRDALARFGVVCDG